MATKKVAEHRPERAPLRTPDNWSLHSSQGILPSSFEPNHEHYHDSSRGLHFRWNSRAHRKGIPPSPEGEPGDEESAKYERWTVERRRVRFVGFDFWDISWWVAIIFVIGSIFWCINGILAFCYFTNTTLPFTNTESATAFLGGTWFIVGAWLGWVESLNPTRDADFGWILDEATKTLVEPKQHDHSLGRNRHHFGRHHTPAQPSALASSAKPATNHAHQNHSKDALVPGLQSTDSNGTLTDAQQTSAKVEVPPNEPPKWRWYGTHPSLAYIANTIQLFGATIFFLSVLCGLPGILPESGSSGGPEQSRAAEGEWIGLYWACQVIGAPCFVIAGAMFCLEVQKHWWLPAPLKLGWQVGFWNLIGGFGFWFCGIFGIWRQSSISNPELYQKWGTAFSTFWGSWAFLIGSYLQLWETINKRTDIV